MNETELRTHYQQPKALVKEAYTLHIEATAQRFIDATTLLIISSINEDGYPDISPRGGVAGFIKTLDANRIAFLDRPGNNKILTFTNLANRPEVGLLFMVPGIKEVLRAYGLANVDQDEALIQSMGGSARKLNKTVVQVQISKIFPHCGNALTAARVWKPEDWSTSGERAIPSLKEMARSMAESRSNKD